MPPSDGPVSAQAGSAKAAGVFLNGDRLLRNGWWVVIFLALLAALLFPILLVSARLNLEVSIWAQVLIIALATIAVQAMRRRSLTEVTGAPGPRALKELGVGLVLGFLLMIAPAAILWFGGWVRFEISSFDPSALLPVLGLTAGAAVAEELLFRGVLFQRLVAGVGVWPAQLVVGALFVLTHFGNPGMQGHTLVLAGANIFLASLLFGQAFLRTRGLALPIGLHFMANVTQGMLLGFGVSGNAEPGLLSPEFTSQTDWLTGGPFGLEASLPGLLTVAVMLGWFVARSRRHVLDRDEA